MDSEEKYHSEVVPKDDPAIALVSDLSGILPASFVLHFQLYNMDLKDGRILLFVDSDVYVLTDTLSVKISGLSMGYHLFRAYLINASDFVSVKRPTCYVEAEGFVGSLSVPTTRGFMFGQPSLNVLYPTTSCQPDQHGECLVDFFVNNCSLGKGPDGYQVSVRVNSKEVAKLSKWCAVKIHVPEGKEFTLQLVLINPKGDELVVPTWNAIERIIQVTSGS